MVGSKQRSSKLPLDTTKNSSLLETVLRRDRQLVTAALVAVITLCWLYLLAGAGTGMYPHEMAELNPSVSQTAPAVPGNAEMPGQQMAMLSPEWTLGYSLLMLAMWWLMMIAMMLPGAAPMVLLHAAVTRNGLPFDTAAVPGPGPGPGSRYLVKTTAAFVGGYIVVWGGFSLVAVIVHWLLEHEALLSPMMTSTSRLLGSGLLLAAGLWQLTPLKTVCLRHCRSPVGFVSTHWRPGIGGAIRMGIDHGVFCLGCCWFLMALLFYAGVMNLIWIIGLAVLVLAEKLLPAGVAFGRVTGLLLIGWGIWPGSSAF